MTAIFVASVALLAYIYAGYPACLWLAVRLRGSRRVRQDEITPALSLVISAYNEAAVMRRKLDNALSLNYPADRREIVVISDASDDGTDAVVGEYAARGVRLFRQPTRRGKTAGLNRTVPQLRGDVVVFSDANAMYEPEALLKLVRNFADPDVGCVTGEARYLSGDGRASDVGERVYWDYEILIKRLETGLGSMVGGDGAIYAIRRSLWRELPENAINDFLNPLQIVAGGSRAVYEPEAVCYEETAGDVRREYKRRVRIVSRSWRAVFQAPGVLNPARVGLFAWSLVSHKILRWLSGVFAIVALVTGVAVVAPWLGAVSWPLVAVVTLAAAALTLTTPCRKLAALFWYFTIIYAASAVGVIKGTMGSVSGVWSTAREDERAAARGGMLIPVGLVLRIAVAVSLAAAVALYWVLPAERVAEVVFWVSVGMLGYVYFGYPLLLALLQRGFGRGIHREPIEPSVCVFIAANDEGDVIAAKLQNTVGLDYPADRLEIVVASDGSVDNTNNVVRAFAPRVRLLELSPRRGKIAAINEGIAGVQSDIVVFSDANTFLQPDAIRTLVRNFADADVGAVSGDVILVGDRAALGRSEDLYYRYERWVQQTESNIGSMIGADGALYAIRRELFTPPPHDTILDDLAIPMGVIKAGRRVVFEGAARAVEQGSESAKEEFARKSRVIAGAVQFMRRDESAVPLAVPQVIFSLVSHKVLRWLSPAFAATALLSSLVLASTASLYAAAMFAQVGLLALALAGCAPPLRRIPPVATAHYFCLLQAAAAVGFLRGLFGRQSVMWRRFARRHSAADGVHA